MPALAASIARRRMTSSVAWSSLRASVFLSVVMPRCYGSDFTFGTFSSEEVNFHFFRKLLFRTLFNIEIRGLIGVVIKENTELINKIDAKVYFLKKKASRAL